MNRARVVQRILQLASGAVLLQLAGCTTPSLIDIAQTVFLGITAAGSFAILQNL